MNSLNLKDQRNLTMLCDFYELTMANGYLENGLGDKEVVFDLFFRRIPDNNGFAIMAGVESMTDYLKNLRFTKEDIEYLRSKNIFSDRFLEYLENFKFTCSVWAIPEGTPIFPQEPLVTVKGNVMQAQLIETMLLLTINHQSLIATKANRIVRAADGRPVLEFGSRRAHCYDSAILGARSAIIGGCVGTACTIADRYYGINATGTMAHSWIQLFADEYEAFKAYAQVYPDNCILLVDTYNVLKSGVPNAIRVAKEVLEPKGYRLKGIRIDSGDLAYLSKEARKMLDKAGLTDCKITVSNSLDEYLIRELLMQGSKIDSFGVGENLITSKNDPVFGGVYKLSAVKNDDGVFEPRIKVSENIEKITNPGFKQVWRLYDKETGYAIADVITLREEEIDDTRPYEIFDPVHTWKRKTIKNFTAKKLQAEIFRDGECVYKSPSLAEITKYCKDQIENTLWDEVKRFENPHKYYVDLSPKLWKIKNDLLNSYMK